MMDSNAIISEFNLRPFGQKGWLKGNLACPECGKKDKFATLFIENSGVCHCFYCSVSFPLGKILKDLGREDLLDYNYEYKEIAELPALIEEKKIEPEKEISLPIGFRRIHNDEYLNERNFQDWQYEQYKVGIAELDPHTNDKLVFQIFQHGKLAGWLARSRNSKEWHHENLREHKEKGYPLILRYRNSNNDFSKMIGGLDDITENTHTLILVEGLFDKSNIDRLTDLREVEEVKCGFTFGSELSNDQINLIPKTVKNVILMYDAGAIRNMQDAGMKLLSLFDVKVAMIEKEEIDPGNIDSNYLSEVFASMYDFLYFYRRILNSNLIK